MSDLIHLEFDAPPWRPSEDAVAGEVFDFYDMPLVGEVTQHGAKFIFQCLEGVVTDLNVWLYTPVHLDEVDQLKHLDGQAFDDEVRSISVSRTGTLAVAVGDRIVGRGIVEDSEFRAYGFSEAIRRLLTARAETEISVASTL